MIRKFFMLATALGFLGTIGAVTLSSDAEAARCYRGPGGWTYCR
jgi:hypothetical protein